jgi:hypothetical protein
MVPTKDMTPHVPLSSEEILEDVAECADLGVAIVRRLAGLADRSLASPRLVRERLGLNFPVGVSSERRGVHSTA